MLEVTAPANEVVLSLWEGEHSIKVEQPAPKASNGDAADDDDDDFEEEPTKAAECKAVKNLTNLSVRINAQDDKTSTVRVTLQVALDGKGSISARQVGDAKAETFKAGF